MNYNVLVSISFKLLQINMWTKRKRVNVTTYVWRENELVYGTDKSWREAARCCGQSHTHTDSLKWKKYNYNHYKKTDKPFRAYVQISNLNFVFICCKWFFKINTFKHNKLELSLNAIHIPTNVLDKAGTRVRWVLHIAQLGWTYESSLKKILPWVYNL